MPSLSTHDSIAARNVRPSIMDKVKISTVVAHIAGWILFLSLPILFITGQPGNKPISEILVTPATWLFFLVYTFLFYFNTYFLIPYLYVKKKYMIYILFIIALFAAVHLLKPFDHLLSTVTSRGDGREQRINDRPPPGNEMDEFKPDDAPPDQHKPRNSFSPNDSFNNGNRPGGFRPIHGAFNSNQQSQPNNRVDIVSIFLFMLVLALSISIHTRYQLKESEQRAQQAESDKINAELSFLKAQINPHFLFNTLNNIYSLAVSKNEHTAESIMKLSNIMRYVTDVRSDFVSLDEELQCIRDYIDLQKLRLGEKVTVDFSLSGNIDNKKIAPLILITFIENVFKYGISNRHGSVISIRIAAEKETIKFYCRNALFQRDALLDSTGIGITNAKQRLEHLYPGKHSLEINNSDGYFTVQLDLVSM